ncbi:guanyl-specific ribonuclease [Thauera sinica]|uniref:Ribonuclease domain-containing protein n=1 Tax=Thauera sinica TaxID=2665146 RepID=A0ABW1AY54_9RHOO|nr:ribonuclease domain-containing protein [Thauera sp. K11]ATE59042.1 ribonuclease [Thauera sp. K11]
MIRTFLVRLLGLLFLLGGTAGCGPAASDAGAGPSARAGQSARHGLPPEALDTLAQIRRGGPFPYRKDGSVFQNRERLLPAMPRGYYREYTVPTPGSHDRGARRIVSGGDPPEVYYYTQDHYRSFRRIEPQP